MGFFKMLARALGLTRHDVRILVVGLDNSGKTTLINHIKPRKASTVEITPTVGFQIEQFSKNNLNFTIFDMSGQNRYRSLWEHYYSDVQAIIFVIDSTDKLRMCVVRDELDNLLHHPSIAGRPVPVLFYANKMDLPTALSPVECLESLDLDRISDKPWHITASNALSGEGVDEGIHWLASRLSGSRK